MDKKKSKSLMISASTTSAARAAVKKNPNAHFEIPTRVVPPLRTHPEEVPNHFRGAKRDRARLTSPDFPWLQEPASVLLSSVLDSRTSKRCIRSQVHPWRLPEPSI